MSEVGSPRALDEAPCPYIYRPAVTGVIPRARNSSRVGQDVTAPRARNNATSSSLIAVRLSPDMPSKDANQEIPSSVSTNRVPRSSLISPPAASLWFQVHPPA